MKEKIDSYTWTKQMMGRDKPVKLIRKLFADKSNFAVIEIKEKTLPYQILDRSYLKSIA